MKHETETCPQEWKMPDQGDSHRLVSALNKIWRCYVCIVEVRGVAIARGVYFLFIITHKVPWDRSNYEAAARISAR